MILVSGSSNKILAHSISKYLNIELISSILGKFECGETRVEILGNVRGEDTIIIQSGFSSVMNVNDILMETILIIDACRRSMVKSITLVMPLFPYSRQDRKDSSRVPISAKAVAKILETSGIDRIVCMDLHSPQIQGFFQCPVDNLYSVKQVHQKLEELFEISKKREEYLLISPDAGATKRTLKFASIMGLKTCIMHKERDYSKPGTISKTMLICDENEIKNKTAIITDDMIDSGGTFVKAAKKLIEKGFKCVIGVITHGYFTSNAIKKIINCGVVSHMIVTNSICQQNNFSKFKNSSWTFDKLIKIGQKSTEFHVIDLGEQLGEAIKRIHENGTLSDLF